MKRTIQTQIKNLIHPETDDKTITGVWIVNDQTGERRLYGKIIVDKPKAEKR